MNQTTDVLIIGAGPTGLSLACQLSRYGVEFVIVEKNEAITPYSKAIGVHARTLEIYEQIGLAQKAIEQGTIAGKGRLIVSGEVRGELEFSKIGESLSAYPYVLMLEQSKNEKLLYEYLQTNGKEVRWHTELETFSQNASGITAQVRTGERDSETIQAKYLVGCDGPKSLVRHTLGLTFGGSTFERVFYVADAQIDWRFSHDALEICLAKDSFVVFFPLKGEKRYRIVGVFREEFSKDEGEVLYEEIESEIRKLSELELEIHDVEWFATYKVHTRHVNRFSQGKCFLAGDAAHIHSPAGAQGMNTGIQDAYNLAWKVALAIDGKAGEKLLQTYNEERLENAKHLLQTTDRMFQFAAGSEWFLSFLRTEVLPPLAKHILNFEPVRRFLFPLISQIGINYRDRSLSEHSGDEDFKVKAGDRVPYFLIDGESIYDKLHEPKFHWLVFSNEASDFQALPSEIGSLAALVDFRVISLEPHIAEAFGVDNPFNLIVRPDNYIGLISSEISNAQVASYLKKALEY